MANVKLKRICWPHQNHASHKMWRQKKTKKKHSRAFSLKRGSLHLLWSKIGTHAVSGYKAKCSSPFRVVLLLNVEAHAAFYFIFLPRRLCSFPMSRLQQQNTSDSVRYFISFIYPPALHPTPHSLHGTIPFSCSRRASNANNLRIPH